MRPGVRSSSLKRERLRIGGTDLRGSHEAEGLEREDQPRKIGRNGGLEDPAAIAAKRPGGDTDQDWDSVRVHCEEENEVERSSATNLKHQV